MTTIVNTDKRFSLAIARVTAPSRRRVAVWLAVLSIAMPSLSMLPTERALAEVIPITNAGFEQDFAAAGTFPIFVPTGWTLVDPGGIIENSQDAVGVLNPTGTTFFPSGAPEGSNVALIFLAGDIGGSPVGLTQVLDATLEANMRYTLSVEVGNIASGFGPSGTVFFDLDGFPGYTVELLAGGFLVAEDANSLDGFLPEGTFATSLIQAEIGETHPGLGLPLEIRLTNLNLIDTPDDPGIEVDFDDLRLEAVTIAEPLPGDVDRDGNVNLIDLSLVQAGMGTEYQRSDVTVIAGNLGATSVPISAAPVAVPEPSSLFLVVVAMAGWLMRRTRLASSGR